MLIRLISVAVIYSGLLAACQFNLGAARPEAKAQTLIAQTLVAKGAYTRGNKSPYEVFGETYEVLPSSVGYREIGIASWYGKPFHGRMTSNGEVYDMYQLTGAHKSLPLPTVVKITNLDNAQSVVIRVNDRGPFHRDRLIDLSYATARILGFVNQGTAPVVVEALGRHNHLSLLEPPRRKVSYYLQAGAFSRLSGAKMLLTKINRLLAQQSITDVEVHILPSEIETGLLHKVWLGAIENPQKRRYIARILEDAKLGTAIHIEVK